MKNPLIVFAILLIGLCFASCESHLLTIDGNVTGLEKQVYLHKYATDGEIQIDSALVSDGKFVFKVKVNEPFLAVITNNAGFYVPVVTDGKHISISGDAGSAQVTGSLLTDKIRESRVVLDEVDFMGVPAGEERDAALEKWKEVLSQLVRENNDNLAGALILESNSYYLLPDETLALIDELTPQMQQTFFIQQQQEFAKGKKNREEGIRFQDIMLPGLDGQDISLSDYAGKGEYVLLDFWASWCGPCLADIPAIKEIYARYHDRGFEIFAVSLDSAKESWQNTISKHELTWVNVSSLKGWSCPAAVKYGVNAIPFSLLIGPDGLIEESDTHPEVLAEVLARIYPDL